MDIPSILLGALPGAVVSVSTFLTSASRSRTNERFNFVERTLEDIRTSVREGDADEERRRTEALRDLDARTSRGISDLRDEITRRFDDLKSIIVSAVSSK
jgi:hypothetical protein